MTAAKHRSSWGTVHKLPSGNYRAMYHHEGRRHTAPTTFATKSAARAWLATVRADIERKQWLPPQQPVTVTNQVLAEYADTWLAQRDLKDRTREHYRKLIDHHIAPAPIGAMPLPAISADDVRAWYAGLDRNTPTARAHTYSLLRTILGTAVTDGKIPANPCVIRGAGSSRRQVVIRPATIDELTKLTEAMPPAYRAMVLLASWCALRFGELAELRRRDVDLDDGVIRVRRGVVHTEGNVIVNTPKSEAGVRDVHIPPHLLPALADHLVDHVAPGRDSLLFPAPDAPGRHLAGTTLHRYFYAARAAAGRPDLRFHDLRHTGAVLAARSGATLAELMARLGHSSPDAALRYQHASAERDRQLAAALSRLVDGL
jgi:integrase